jgi:hypothetical protein
VTVHANDDVITLAILFPAVLVDVRVPVNVHSDSSPTSFTSLPVSDVDVSDTNKRAIRAVAGVAISIHVYSSPEFDLPDVGAGSAVTVHANVDIIALAILFPAVLVDVRVPINVHSDSSHQVSAMCIAFIGSKTTCRMLNSPVVPASHFYGIGRDECRDSPPEHGIETSSSLQI